MKKMIFKTKGIYLILIGIIFVIIFGPFNNFKTKTKIDIQNKINGKNINGSKIKIDSNVNGISWNQKEINLKNDNRIIINNFSLLHLGIYSKITLKLSFERLVNNEIIKTDVKIESVINGIGNLKNKKNHFNSIIIKRIDEIYSKHKQTQKNNLLN